MIFAPLAFLVATVVTATCNFLEMIPWRRAAGAHWTERARALYPARVSRQMNLLGITAGLALLCAHYAPEIAWQWFAVAAVLGITLGGFPMDRALDPGLTFRRWVEQLASHCLLIYPVWIVTGLVAVVMPARFGWPAWVIASVFVVIHLGFQYGLGLYLMRRLGLLRRPSPRLQALVDETCARLGIKVTGTWEVPLGYANAAALPSTGEVLFAEKMLAVCSDEQVKAICAHELGHISESRWVLAGRIAGTFQVLPLIFIRPVNALYPFGFIVLLLAFLGIMLLTLCLLRKMETRADKVAREGIEEATVYARALERLYQSGQIPAVMLKRAGMPHPDLYDRMLAAGLTPDFPRPAPPKGQGWTSTLLAIACVLIAFFIGSENSSN
jgi:Zn-dependent protease with chaperone function